MGDQGGYSDVYVPFCGLAVMEELSGVKTDVEDCFLGDVDNWGGQELQPHQTAVIDKSVAVVDAMKRRLEAAP